MKELSADLLASTVSAKRKEKKLTQSDLSKATGINRALISQLENKEFTPSANQLMALASVLDFNIESVFAEPKTENKKHQRATRLLSQELVMSASPLLFSWLSATTLLL